MCGIGGIVGAHSGRADLENRLLAMQHALRHRGPDDQGLFLSTHAVAGLVSTRLAILDLSPAGHQPMQSADGRYTIVFNGEIYNFRTLRAELLVDGYLFESNSDTEVVLQSYQREEAKCLERLEGMFGFAVWDEQERTLFLARDPLGIKPLYYCVDNGSLCFASEIRTLLRSGLISGGISAEGVRGYLMSGSVPEPATLVEGVRMLPAGQYLTWRDGKTETTKYWEVGFGKTEGGRQKAETLRSSAPALSLPSSADCSVRCPQRGQEESPLERADATTAKQTTGGGKMSYGDATRLVREALEESIARHLVSDVPVGVFLSGGIDSTTLVALASQKVREPLRTFTISFDDSTYDEGSVAAKTAAHFRTKHTDWRLDSANAKKLLEEFLERSDQPSIDGFNTFCVSKMAHDHGLKVVLSGLGGDEVFGGYQSFRKIPQMLAGSKRLGLLGPLRGAAGWLLQISRAPRTRRVGSFLSNAPDIEAAYACMRGVFTAREAGQLLPLFGINGEDLAAANMQPIPAQPTLEDEVSYLELTRYMRNQLLRDSDVMSMAWSLELRVPLVDRKLIDAVSQIPAQWRLARGKQMLLDAVPEIPEWVRRRPKQGFTFPFQDWVTTEWRDVFERIEKNSPVPLGNWYRTWCLFALEKFIQKLKADN